MEASEEIISTKVTGNKTEQLVKKVFYEERDGKMCRITQTINRTTMRTYARDIKPFGAALNANNASCTSIGDEVFFEKPPASARAYIPEPRTLGAPPHTSSFSPAPEPSCEPRRERQNYGSYAERPRHHAPTFAGAPAHVPLAAPGKKTFASFATRTTSGGGSSYDEEEYKRTVFMENIPDEADRNDIADFLSEVACVDKVTIKRINVVYDGSGRSRGKAFAVFNTGKIAAQVIERVDGAVFGQYCIVHAQLAKPRGS